MKWRTTILVLTFFGLCQGAAQADGPTPEERKALEVQIIGVLNGRGVQMDQCTERYLTEYPEQKGSVALAMSVDPSGKVLSATAQTGLTGARNLRPCIEAVAKGYIFPTTKGDKPAPINLTIPVEKGAKFKIYPPGEAPKPKEGPPPSSGFLRFTPADWGPAQTPPATP